MGASGLTRPRIVIVEASLPYYRVEASWDSGHGSFYAEAVITPGLPPILRATLFTPRLPGAAPTPLPGYRRLDPEPWETLRERLTEGFREILEGEDRQKPPFEFEGLRGLIKMMLTLGKHKPYTPTKGLIARSAYNYVYDVLGITSVPRLRERGITWRQLRITVQVRGDKPSVERVEALSGNEQWTVDRVLTRLAREYPWSFAPVLRRLGFTA